MIDGWAWRDTQNWNERQWSERPRRIKVNPSFVANQIRTKEFVFLNNSNYKVISLEIILDGTFYFGLLLFIALVL